MKQPDVGDPEHKALVKAQGGIEGILAKGEYNGYLLSDQPTFNQHFFRASKCNFRANIEKILFYSNVNSIVNIGHEVGSTNISIRIQKGCTMICLCNLQTPHRIVKYAGDGDIQVITYFMNHMVKQVPTQVPNAVCIRISRKSKEVPSLEFLCQSQLPGFDSPVALPHTMIELYENTLVHKPILKRLSWTPSPRSRKLNYLQIKTCACDTAPHIPTDYRDIHTCIMYRDVSFMYQLLEGQRTGVFRF